MFWARLRVVLSSCNDHSMCGLAWRRRWSRIYWWLQSFLAPRNLARLAPVERLSERVVRVLGANPGPMTLQGTNTYLVGTGRRRLLIDAGSSHVSAYIERLERALSEQCAVIDQVIVTHRHSDHVGGVADVRRRLGPVPVRKFVCRADTTGGGDGGASAAAAASGGGARWKSATGSCSGDAEGESAALLTGGRGGAGVWSYERLADGDVVEVEGATLQVLHTPGHTEDHVALWLQEERAVFSGDCVLGETSGVFQNLRQYMASLRRIRQLEPCALYPGHGAALVDKCTALRHIDSYIEHRQLRERQLLAAFEQLSAPVTVDQLVTAVYRDSIRWWMRRAARLNVASHLEKLVEEGVVLQLSDGRFTLSAS